MSNPNFVPEHSTYEIWKADDTSICLDDYLNDLETDIENKADSDHTHNDYAASNHTHTGYAEVEHTHSGYASSDHTHSDYAASSHTHTEYASSDHTHDDYANASHVHAIANITGLQIALDSKATVSYVDSSIANLLNNSSDAVDSIMELNEAMTNNADAITALQSIASGKANAVHTHDLATEDAAGFQSPADKVKLNGIEANANNYTHPSTHPISMISGLESALNGKAPSSHTHTGYASATHTHDGYAPTSHSHTATEIGALPINGGTINGDTNVAGVLKVNSQQAFYYQTSTASQTIGTNNATGGTTICCGSSSNVAVNGANLKTPNTLPKTNNTYYCGNSNFRWKGIYSTSAVNVSSDERLKRDITSLDNAKLANFVNGLNVVSYNYKDDEQTEKARIGLIAQQVQKVDSDIANFFVSTEEDGMLSLTPADLVYPLICAVQELKKEIEELKK